MSNDCIFCKIVAGQIPAARVYEDDLVIAFMDIGPLVKGHVLVIPKQHADPITQMPQAILHHLMTVVQLVAQAQMKGLQADGVNIHQANGAAAGQAVAHVHFHVVPRFHADGHHWNWVPKKYAGVEEMRALAGKIHAAMPGENT